jgi:hypothetical protein
MSDGNSTIPTEAEHDAHFVHRCCDCELPFGRVIGPKAGDCPEGDLCQDCWEARGEGGE